MIRVGVSPWTHINPDCLTSDPKCEAGVELDILEMIRKLSNLKLTFKTSKIAGCGKTPSDLGTNGSWTGLLKMLIDDEIDMIGQLCDTNKFYGSKELSSSWPGWQYQDQFVLQTPTPPPLSFAPLTPFTMSVWFAYAFICLIYLTFIIIYFYIRHGRTIRDFPSELFLTLTALNNFFYRFAKLLPLQFIGPLWLLVVTSAYIFYATFILSAVLHPFPVWKPFSNCDEMVRELLTGRYRLLSYKSPPSTPNGCLSTDCKSQFKQAINSRGFEYLPDASGAQLLSAIAYQSEQSESKLVLENASPFISLYLSEFPQNQDRLWLINDESFIDLRSAYVWRKNFTYADRLNRNIIEISDYRYNALARYNRPYGARPQMSDRISENVHQQSLSLYKFRNLFLTHLGLITGAMLVFLFEVIYARYRKRNVVMVLDGRKFG